MNIVIELLQIPYRFDAKLFLAYRGVADTMQKSEIVSYFPKLS